MRQISSLTSCALALLSMFGSQQIAWAQERCGADPKGNCGSNGYLAGARGPVTAAPVVPSRPATPARVAPTPHATAKPARAVAPMQQASSVIAPAPVTPYAYCWGGLSGQTQVAYFGAPFEAHARNVPVWSAAYKKVLHEKYNFAGVIHCGTLKSLGAAQERMQKEKDQMRAHWKVVETGWKYQ